MLEGIELLTCQHLMGYQTDTSNLKAKLEDDECPFQMVQGGSFKDPNYPRTPLNWNLTYSNVIQWSTWVWYIAIKYDMIWYDMIRYDMIWYDVEGWDTNWKVLLNNVWLRFVWWRKASAGCGIWGLQADERSASCSHLATSHLQGCYMWGKRRYKIS